jgi:prevent-host-death family protein
MRVAGIREARQNLTALLDDVRKGREVVISDRGRPVAMLVPVTGRRPFPDLRNVRRRVARRGLHLSEAVLDGREDR